MEKMLNLLGGEDPRILFVETFLHLLSPRIQTALANMTITEPRALAEEADRFFLATQQPGADVLAATLSAPSPVRRAWGEQTVAAPGRRGDTGECFYHAWFGAKAKKCKCRGHALGGPERWRHEQASLRYRLWLG